MSLQPGAQPDSSVTAVLLDNLQEGQKVFDQLFSRHREYLKAAIEYRLDKSLRTRLDASDIVQETELQAFERMEDYLQRRPMPFRIWLRKTAQERLIMARRKHITADRRSVMKELPVPRNSSVQLFNMIADEQSPSAAMNEEELGTKVRMALVQLDEKDREVLLMRHYENLSYNDIACILEIEPATARQRSGRALIRLTEILTIQGLTDSQL